MAGRLGLGAGAKLDYKYKRCQLGLLDGVDIMAKKKKKRIQKRKRKMKIKKGRDGKIEVLVRSEDGRTVKKRKKKKAK